MSPCQGLPKQSLIRLTPGDLACVQICLSIEQNIGSVITSIPTLADPFLIFLNHTRTSFLGRFLWPNPPSPSCWGDSQTDGIHLQSPPMSSDWTYDPERNAAAEDADFWHSVDVQMGQLSFDACAHTQKTPPSDKPSSRQPSKTRSRWSRPVSRWGSRSGSQPKSSVPHSTNWKGTPPRSTTPTSTPLHSRTPISSPTGSMTRVSMSSKPNTPGSSKSNSKIYSHRPSRDRSPGGSMDRRSFRGRISRPSSWIRWSWKTGDDPGDEP